MEPLWMSLQAAALCAVIAWFLAGAAARARFSAPSGLRWALDLLFLLPLAFPATLAMPLVAHPSPYALPGADSLFALPLFYLCAILGFRRVQREGIDAARLQGLGCCGIFWRVWFPAAWPWLIGGLALGLFRAAILVVPLSTGFR